MPKTEAITTPKPRRSRYRRDPGDVPAIRIQERDIEIVKAVWQHRFLTTRQIALLIDGIERLSDEKQFQSRLTVFQMRLKGLWLNRFLDRLELRAQMYHGSSQAVYALDSQGADLLSNHSGEDPQVIDWNLKQNKIGDRYLEHALMVSNFLVALQLACRHPDFQHIEFVPMGHGRDLQDRVEVRDEKGKTMKLSVAPDYTFALKDTRFAAGQDTAYFFLEADRGTMSHKRMCEKYAGYWHYHQQKRHQERLKIPAFRVLTLTRSVQRRETLRQLAVRLAGLPRNKGFLWFGTERDVDLKKPGTVFGPIWRRAVEPDTQPYGSLLRS